MISIKAIFLAASLVSMGFSGSSGGATTCESLFQPKKDLSKKLKDLNQSDYVGYMQWDVEKTQLNAQRLISGHSEEVESIKAQHVKDDNVSEYNKCVDMEKEETTRDIEDELKIAQIKKSYKCGEDYKRLKKWENNRLPQIFQSSQDDLNREAEGECNQAKRNVTDAQDKLNK